MFMIFYYPMHEPSPVVHNLKTSMYNIARVLWTLAFVAICPFLATAASVGDTGIVEGDSATEALSISKKSDTPSRSRLACFREDGKNVLHIAGNVLTAPSQARAAYWLVAGGSVASIGLCALADNRVRAVALDHQSAVGDQITRPGNIYGRTRTAVILATGLYGSGMLFRNAWLRSTGSRLTVALVLSVATTSTGKFVVGRARPFTDNGTKSLHPFSLNDAYQSFPSGHATSAFVISSCLAGCIDNTAVSIVLYSLATLTAAQRVYRDRHWLSDVATGALVGTFFGYTSAKVGRDRVLPQSWQIVPIVSPDSYGLMVSMKLK